MASSSQAESRGLGKNKRKWTADEDDKLIETLLELVNSGTHRADNGFKQGYLNVIEQSLLEKLSGKGIKVKPHIESRIKVLKRDFCIFHDMFNGIHTSGFGFDHVKKCLTASYVWEGYLESHKGAKKFRDRSFPFYEDLCIIFGKDQATGREGHGAVDVTELEREKGNIEHEIFLHGSDDMNTFMSSMQRPSVPPRLKKKSRGMEEMVVEGLMSTASLISTEIKKATTIFARAIGVDVVVRDMKKKIYEDLLMLPDFSISEMLKASSVLVHDSNYTDLFFSFPKIDRTKLVRGTLREDF